jgi:hypothetical protein
MTILIGVLPNFLQENADIIPQNRRLFLPYPFNSLFTAIQLQLTGLEVISRGLGVYGVRGVLTSEEHWTIVTGSDR